MCAGNSHEALGHCGLVTVLKNVMVGVFFMSEGAAELNRITLVCQDSGNITA